MANVKKMEPLPQRQKKVKTQLADKNMNLCELSEIYSRLSSKLESLTNVEPDTVTPLKTHSEDLYPKSDSIETPQPESEIVIPPLTQASLSSQPDFVGHLDTPTESRVSQPEKESTDTEYVEGNLKTLTEIKNRTDGLLVDLKKLSEFKEVAGYIEPLRSEDIVKSKESLKTTVAIESLEILIFEGIGEIEKLLKNTENTELVEYLGSENILKPGENTLKTITNSKFDHPNVVIDESKNSKTSGPFTINIKSESPQPEGIESQRGSEIEPQICTQPESPNPLVTLETDSKTEPDPTSQHKLENKIDPEFQSENKSEPLQIGIELGTQVDTKSEHFNYDIEPDTIKSKPIKTDIGPCTQPDSKSIHLIQTECESTTGHGAPTDDEIESESVGAEVIVDINEIQHEFDILENHSNPLTGSVSLPKNVLTDKAFSPDSKSSIDSSETGSVSNNTATIVVNTSNDINVNSLGNKEIINDDDETVLSNYNSEYIKDKQCDSPPIIITIPNDDESCAESLSVNDEDYKDALETFSDTTSGTDVTINVIPPSPTPIRKDEFIPDQISMKSSSDANSVADISINVIPPSPTPIRKDEFIPEQINIIDNSVETNCSDDFCDCVDLIKEKELNESDATITENISIDSQNITLVEDSKDIEVIKCNNIDKEKETPPTPEGIDEGTSISPIEDVDIHDITEYEIDEDGKKLIDLNDNVILVTNKTSDVNDQDVNNNFTSKLVEKKVSFRDDIKFNDDMTSSKKQKSGKRVATPRKRINSYPACKSQEDEYTEISLYYRKRTTPSGAVITEYIKHKLEYMWSLWYFRPDQIRNWTDGQHRVLDFDTVEDFWSVHNHIIQPSELRNGCDYSIFKEYIPPMWEDAVNVKGGRWLITFSKYQHLQDIDFYWQEILLLMIGGAFDEDRNEICGAVVNKRPRGDKIAVWIKNGNKKDAILRIGKTIKETLNLPKNFLIVFQLHKDATVSKGNNIKNIFSI